MAGLWGEFAGNSCLRLHCLSHEFSLVLEDVILEMVKSWNKKIKTGLTEMDAVSTVHMLKL